MKIIDSCLKLDQILSVTIIRVTAILTYKQRVTKDVSGESKAYKSKLAILALHSPVTLVLAPTLSLTHSSRNTDLFSPFNPSAFLTLRQLSQLI